MKDKSGFTLIEMSIVLVIIGLLIGGILVGRDLINAAALGSQISQIGKYNSAVNTFRFKYGWRPGDIPSYPAGQNGLQARGGYAGEGDGNGLLEGIWENASDGYWGAAASGETVMFWVDLSAAKLIEGGFNTATATNIIPMNTTSDFDKFFPSAKIGNANYVYVWSGGYISISSGTGYVGDAINYFGISAINSVDAFGCMVSSPRTTVQQAYNIDKKIDDGLPQSGNVLALYDSVTCGSGYNAKWAGVSTGSNAPTTAATPYAVTNCYDNNNVAGTQTYSLAKNANALNCALSFVFQ